MKTYKEFINENKETNPVREYWDNGNIKSEEWFNSKGECHRVDGPSIQYWYENGQKNFEQWYLDGKRHRIDGPAYQWWYENGQKWIEWWYLGGNNYNKLEWENKLKKDYPEEYKDYIMKLDFDNMGI